ncbi:unnamed protein product (macronuclear) [Paramecium tetraurelia]|uniref:Replication protein A C-terminal domain-containing protein n=1 Tax=Paramecium tetraurelia TaxID=5888 RepID=A0BCJ0_PARTE|nr:uncharacterized protein GSPATT00004351001 [Paramecium tetraurelia]CAK56257.1 unnamed protein product [Paramecium tetraurelia]|eukprot:XP_001423655.1 hypothetical protein (macronuclear) [Paramecium tetraurelia strain d4-2]
MFQQSQFSDQKNQSGFKQGNNYNEQVTNMTIKMIKKIKQSTTDRNEILYFDKQITLIQLVARFEQTNEAEGKGFITINDDSGYLKLSLLFSEGTYIREMFDIFKEEEPKINYFQFLLRARVNKDTICFDIMNIKKTGHGYLVSHMLNIIQQAIKSNQIGNPNFVQANTQIDEEEQQRLTQLSLSTRILNFIKAQTQQLGPVSITQQSIINEFSQTDKLQEIKQSIRQLLDSGNIQSGQGVNTYMLVD